MSKHAAAEKAIADAVEGHKNAGGLVTIYPLDDPNAGRVEGVPAVQQDVEPDKAVELLLMRPPAFTLYESGNGLKEHALLDEIEHDQAWGDADESASPPKLRTPSSRKAAKPKAAAKPQKESKPSESGPAPVQQSEPQEPAQNAEA